MFPSSIAMAARPSRRLRRRCVGVVLLFFLCAIHLHPGHMSVASAAAVGGEDSVSSSSSSAGKDRKDIHVRDTTSRPDLLLSQSDSSSDAEHGHDESDSDSDGEDGGDDAAVFDGRTRIDEDEEDDEAANKPVLEEAEVSATSTLVVDSAASYARSLSASSSSPPAASGDAADSSIGTTTGDVSPTTDAGSAEGETDGRTAETKEGLEGRNLTRQRKYVQTKERGRKGTTKKWTVLTKKELRLRMQRRRRRRRRKREHTLADRADKMRGKKNKEDVTTGSRNEAPPKVAHPDRIQERDDGASSSSSEDKEFADRATSRTRDSADEEEVDEEEVDGAAVQGDSVGLEGNAPRQQHAHRPDLVSPPQQSESKGGWSEDSEDDEDDDGPQMVYGPPVSDNARIRWRCAYPGEKVLTTNIPESVGMTQQINFAPPAPQTSRPERNSWLKGWSFANGGFGKRRGNNNDDRRAAEKSKGGGVGGGAQLISSSAAVDKDKLYILPGNHNLCKTMKFVCPAKCADRPDFMCREAFTCKYPAPLSLVVSQPAEEEEEEERPRAQKRLPPLPISTSGSDKGGKGGRYPYRTQAGDRSGKGGSSSDDYSADKKHRGSRPRNLAEGDVEAEEDSFDADIDLVVAKEEEGRGRQDPFDNEALRSLQGNSKGYAKRPTTAPVGPQLTNVNVQPECISTGHQILPDDYYMCSHLEPPPEAECPKELPENDKDYDTLLDNLPNRCKEKEPDFLPTAPDLPPKAIDDRYTTTEDTPITANIIGELLCASLVMCVFGHPVYSSPVYSSHIYLSTYTIIPFQCISSFHLCRERHGSRFGKESAQGRTDQ